MVILPANQTTCSTKAFAHLYYAKLLDCNNGFKWHLVIISGFIPSLFSLGVCVLAVKFYYLTAWSAFYMPSDSFDRW